MEKDLISVIIPVYKVEKFLDRCIESVVNQTYKNLEIILVDDGSPDKCGEMCDEWAKKDDRIEVIHKPNGGLSDARNIGIDKCKGDFIMFVDSDDYLDLEICSKLHKILKEFNADFSMCNAKKFYENDNLIINENKVKDVKLFKDDNVLKQLQHTCSEYLVVAWAKLYKRQIFNSIRYPKGKLHEDEFVIHKVLDSTNKFVYFNEELYYYLQRNSSITSNISERNIEHILQAFEDRFNYLNSVNKMFSSNDNYLHYMGNLRGLYCKACNYKFKIKKDILNKFKMIYKTAPQKSWKDFLFKYFRLIYRLLWKIKG